MVKFLTTTEDLANLIALVSFIKDSIAGRYSIPLAMRGRKLHSMLIKEQYHYQ